MLSICIIIFTFITIVPFSNNSLYYYFRTPEESFTGLGALGYTFTPHFVELCGGNLHLPRVHYIDEVYHLPIRIVSWRSGSLYLYLTEQHSRCYEKMKSQVNYIKKCEAKLANPFQID